MSTGLFRSLFSAPAARIQSYFSRAVRIEAARGFILLRIPAHRVTERDPKELCIVVPTKKCRTAVIRNRVKRRVKNALWNTRETWRTPQIQIVICPPSAALMSSEELNERLTALMRQPALTSSVTD